MFCRTYEIKFEHCTFNDLEKESEEKIKMKEILDFLVQRKVDYIYSLVIFTLVNIIDFIDLII